VNQVPAAFDGESLITPELIATEVVSSKTASHDEQLAAALPRLALVLQIAQQRFEGGGDPAKIMDHLFSEMHKLRAALDPATWRELVPVAQGHALSEFVHQDPLARWSFEKPRGYSGDAQLLDFIYGHESTKAAVAGATPLGQAIYGYMKDAPAAQAVRERRDLLTKYVDEIAEERGPGTEILTIAAGHLREADRSTALQDGRISRWIALDQDPLSVGSVARDFHGTRVDAIDGSVRGLLADTYKLGTFDFIYSAGLYDYLTDSVAVRLAKRCMKMLKPNGVLLFANFSPELSDDGYMETFMNWALLLRSEADMWNIINASVDRNAVEASVSFDENRNIVYATIKKRG
jgi:hypothetical protein